jgi:hypothetical protein
MSDSKDYKLPATLPANGNDGWADTAAEAANNIIRGIIVRYADWRWTQGAEATEIEEGTQFVVLGAAAAWVKWKDGKPVEYVVRQPGKPLPELDELSDRDKSTWETGPDGQPRDPWANSRFVYLVDPVTLEVLTFVTSSIGGRQAVTNLADQVMRMRSLGHPNALPIVELGAVEMPTKFGRKSKPVFKIIKWYGSEATDAARLPKPLMPSTSAEEIVEPSLRDELDDAIPF